MKEITLGTELNMCFYITSNSVADLSAMYPNQHQRHAGLPEFHVILGQISHINSEWQDLKAPLQTAETSSIETDC